MLNKDKIQGLIFGAGVASLVFLSSASALADPVSKGITAVYNSIQIYVDGSKVSSIDSDGAAVEPFIYNGSTYVPLRAVAEALRQPVEWDDASNSIYIGKKPDLKASVTTWNSYGGDWKVPGSEGGLNLKFTGANTANMTIDDISSPPANRIAQIEVNNIMFEADGTALFTFDDDGWGTSGKGKIELKSNQVIVTIEHTMSAHENWSIFQGKATFQR
jgi:hypothetical protein